MNTLGHIHVDATFYNPIEYLEYVQGRRGLENVGKVDLKALVDTGATFPALPEDIVDDLNLPICGRLVLGII